MKKSFVAAAVLFMLAGCDNKKGAFIETVSSENDLPTTVNRFLSVIKENKLVHFATIDHAANAKKVHMDLKPETVVLFGDPRAGTKLMECNPSMGMDLPLKMLFTTNYEGNTTISYTNPEYWTLKHNIKDKQCLGIIQKMHMAMKALAKAAAKKQ